MTLDQLLDVVAPTGAREPRTRDVDRVLAAIHEIDSEGGAPTIEAIQERTGIENRGSLRAWVHVLAKEEKIQTEYERPGPNRHQIYRPSRHHITATPENV